MGVWRIRVIGSVGDLFRVYGECEVERTEEVKTGKD